MSDEMPDFSNVQSGSSSTAPTIYEVKAGDSLSKIAKAHYGNANDWNRIFEANRDVLKDPNKIYPGQKPTIPPKSPPNPLAPRRCVHGTVASTSRPRPADLTPHR